jgi:hypothetical protein
LAGFTSFRQIGGTAMRQELHNDVEGQPPYTMMPEELTDSFQAFCAKCEVEVDIDPAVLRGGGKPYDYVGLKGKLSVEELREMIAVWNWEQRAAKRAK